MPATDLQRITGFRMSFARRQAAIVREVPCGAAVLDLEYAFSHEHNQLLIDGTAAPAELPALADKTLGHLPYRRITILDDATGAACAPELTAAGYHHDIELVMTRTGESPVPRAPAESVTLDEMRSALTRQLCAWMPQATDGHTRRGYADTVIATALHLAAGYGLVFLLADAGDWPRTWYTRRGFTTIGRSHAFTRPETVA